MYQNVYDFWVLRTHIWKLGEHKNETILFGYILSNKLHSHIIISYLSYKHSKIVEAVLPHMIGP
jgi:hypothetical protein